MSAITPFKIAITDAQIKDLKARLKNTRWPQAVVKDCTHGQPVSFIHELDDQWLNKFDWRKQERELNAFPQFTNEIDGQTIHFLHIKSKEPNAFPLIMTHGWPSSAAEFIDIIGPLTAPHMQSADQQPSQKPPRELI